MMTSMSIFQRFKETEIKKIDEFPYEENYQNLKSIKLMNKEGTEGILNLSIIDV